MRSVELDAILGAMLQSYDGISDLNFSVGRPLQVEAFGQLKPIAVDPPIDSLTPYQTENIALNIMGYNRPGCRVTGGTVRLAGAPMGALSERQRAAKRGSFVSYVPQSAAAAFNAQSVAARVPVRQ